MVDKLLCAINYLEECNYIVRKDACYMHRGEIYLYVSKEGRQSKPTWLERYNMKKGLKCKIHIMANDGRCIKWEVSF